MTQPEREPSFDELLAERRELFARLKDIYERNAPDDVSAEILFRFFETNLELDGLLISRAISNWDAVKWMKEEIGMLRDQVRDLSDGKAA